MPSSTGGTTWNRFSRRSSGWRERSLISPVAAYRWQRIQPRWLHQNPRCGLCTSSGWSEYLWWLRWCAAHQSTPFCALVWAQNASTNWKMRPVLKPRCEAYRWYPIVVPAIRA